MGKKTRTQNPNNVKSSLTLCGTLFELERSEKEETALYRVLHTFNMVAQGGPLDKQAFTIQRYTGPEYQLPGWLIL